MRRFIIFIFVYAAFLCIPIQANNSEVHYKIFSDTEEKKVYEYKEEVLMILDYLCKGVDESSYSTLIQEKINVFESLVNSKVSFKRDTLYIIIGDGKGKRLSGTYKQKNACYEEVKPKSKIFEMLGINNK